jgi:hypothetical protein
MEDNSPIQGDRSLPIGPNRCWLIISPYANRSMASSASRKRSTSQALAGVRASNELKYEREHSVWADRARTANYTLREK